MQHFVKAETDRLVIFDPPLWTVGLIDADSTGVLRVLDIGFHN